MIHRYSAFLLLALLVLTVSTQAETEPGPEKDSLKGKSRTCVTPLRMRPCRLQHQRRQDVLDTLLCRRSLPNATSGGHAAAPSR